MCLKTFNELNHNDKDNVIGQISKKCGSLADRVAVAGGAVVLVRVVCDVQIPLSSLHHFSIGL